MCDMARCAAMVGADHVPKFFWGGMGWVGKKEKKSCRRLSAPRNACVCPAKEFEKYEIKLAEVEVLSIRL